ncbi:MAG: SDR family NAD(P)-dependent oxidoreductase [Bosea sp. (in: a-proteobacteria)]
MAETALITGASSLVGQAVARGLAQVGQGLVLHAHGNLAAIEVLAAELRASGTSVTLLQSDLADPQAAARLVPDAAAVQGPLTMLVNAALSHMPDSLLALDVPTWNRQFSINIRAPSVLAGAFAAQLPKGQKGCILLRIDQRRWRPAEGNYSYSLSQAAMADAIRTMARALAPDIRVNAASLGPDMTAAEQLDQPASADQATRLAAALLFLAKAQAVTGQMMVV